MLIEKVSMLTNKVHIREIDVTREQVENWQGGMLIQDAMPNLSIDDREFMMTGATADEWAALEEEDE
jgi:transcriptional regulator of nitric oxide reductase